MSEQDTPTERPTLNSATTVRIGLFVMLVLILLAMAGGCYLAYTFLEKTAREVAQIQTKAQSVTAQVDNLVRLEGQLKHYKNDVKKAQQIVAESKSYHYQNQIINDLTNYASQAGVPIASFNFQDKAAASSKTASANAKNNANTNSGLKSTQISVQLGAHVEYVKLLRFLHLIEQNLTRMQIAGISLTSGEQAGTVGAQAIDLEVYVK